MLPDLALGLKILLMFWGALLAQQLFPAVSAQLDPGFCFRSPYCEAGFKFGEQSCNDCLSGTCAWVQDGTSTVKIPRHRCSVESKCRNPNCAGEVVDGLNANYTNCLLSNFDYNKLKIAIGKCTVKNQDCFTRNGICKNFYEECVNYRTYQGIDWRGCYVKKYWAQKHICLHSGGSAICDNCEKKVNCNKPYCGADLALLSSSKHLQVKNLYSCKKCQFLAANKNFLSLVLKKEYPSFPHSQIPWPKINVCLTGKYNSHLAKKETVTAADPLEASACFMEAI